MTHDFEDVVRWATDLVILQSGHVVASGSIQELTRRADLPWLREMAGLGSVIDPTHFGRAYGIERAADMLGAVAGPLVAALLIWVSIDFRTVILVSLVPSLLAALAFFSMTRDRGGAMIDTPASPSRTVLPRRFWICAAGVALFGVGDFSRTFLILLAAAAFGAQAGTSGVVTTGSVSVAVLLYAAHNAVSALAAYPAGSSSDKGSKVRIPAVGYSLGVVTNVLLAFSFGARGLLVAAIVLSGVYIAVEETLEKAVAAEMLPREQRSLGLGVLASANAVGDMLSSVGVGLLLAAGHSRAAFLVPAAFGLSGTVWMTALAWQRHTTGASR